MHTARAALRLAERALRAARGRYLTATTADILLARKALDAAKARRNRAADRYASALGQGRTPGQAAPTARHGIRA